MHQIFSILSIILTIGLLWLLTASFWSEKMSTLLHHVAASTALSVGMIISYIGIMVNYDLWENHSYISIIFIVFITFILQVLIQEKSVPEERQEDKRAEDEHILDHHQSSFIFSRSLFGMVVTCFLFIGGVFWMLSFESRLWSRGFFYLLTHQWLLESILLTLFVWTLLKRELTSSLINFNPLIIDNTSPPPSGVAPPSDGDSPSTPSSDANSPPLSPLDTVSPSSSLSNALFTSLSKPVSDSFSLSHPRLQNTRYDNRLKVGTNISSIEEEQIYLCRAPESLFMVLSLGYITAAFCTSLNGNASLSQLFCVCGLLVAIVATWSCFCPKLRMGHATFTLAYMMFATLLIHAHFCVRPEFSSAVVMFLLLSPLAPITVSSNRTPSSQVFRALVITLIPSILAIGITLKIVNDSLNIDTSQTNSSSHRP